MAQEKKKRSRGRPTKLTDETIDALCEKLSKGFTYAVACAHAGISYQTLLNWKRDHGEAKSGFYFDLFDKLRTAEMEGRGLMEARALKESPALHVLERRYPEDWGKIDKHEHSGPDGSDITFRILRAGDS